MNVKNYKYILVLIVLVALGVRLFELNEPWVGLKDFTGALHGQIAKNYVRIGLLGSRLGPITNFEKNPDQLTYYMHHPILFNVLLTVPIHIFGAKEWAMRLLPVAASTACVILIFFLTRMLWGNRTALFASLFLAFVPMEGYFGRMVNEESLAVAIMLGLLILYVQHLRRTANEKRRMSWGFYALLVVGLFTAWPIYYLTGIIFIHDFLNRVRTGGYPGYSFFLPIAAVLVFGIFLLHGRYLTGDWGQSLLVIFLERAGTESDLMGKTNLLAVIGRRLTYFFTPILLLLSGLSLPGIPSKKSLYPRGGVLILCFLYLVAIIHVVLFRQGALHHEYWLYYFSVPMAITAALGLEYFMSVGRHSFVRTLILIALLGIFISLSLSRVVELHSIDKFAYVPRLGEWVQNNTEEDDEILVIGPSLAGFGYSEKHFDYHLGNVYTWPMPHVGYYAERKIKWGIRDVDELETILAEPGKLKYALMSEQHMDSLVVSALEYLSSTTEEIVPEEWRDDGSIPLRIFELTVKSPDETGRPGG